MNENTYPGPVVVRSTQELGKTIIHARKAHGYSQQQFADLAGVGRRFVSELENGKASAEFGKVLQVLTALGIDLQLRHR